MLSLGTQQKLAAVLQTIAEGETKLEMCRFNLCELPFYVPYSAFRRIDRANLGYLTVSDLSNFFVSTSIPISQSDVQLIMKCMDRNFDNKLTFDEFNDSFVVRMNSQLRQEVVTRNAYPVSPSQVLEFEIELAMARLLEQISRCQREYDQVRAELVSCVDFSLSAAFQLLDIDQIGFIDTKKIGQFLRSKGKPLLEKEVKLIIVFADIDLDQRLSYKEFSDMMIVGQPAPAFITPKSISIAKPEAIRSTIMGVASPTTIGQFASKIAGPTYSPRAVAPSYSPRTAAPSYSPRVAVTTSYSPRAASPVASQNPNYRPDSPGGQRVAVKYQTEQYQKAEDNLKYTQYLEQKDALKKSLSPKAIETQNNLYSSQNQFSQMMGVSQTAQTALPQLDEEHLMGMLKQMIGYDRDLQTLKTQLSYRNDFNLLDAFKLFDINQNQQISKQEFEQGLNKLGIFPTANEIFLFFQTYDRDLDNFLQFTNPPLLQIQFRFGEFSQVFYTPNQSQIDLLNSRKPALYSESVIDFVISLSKKVFSFDTKMIFKNILLKLLETEIIFDNFKEQLSRRPSFNLYSAFQTLDMTKDGSISYEDLKEMLGTYGIYTTETDMVNIFKRFDKNMDGKIHYSEFVEGMSPRATNKSKY